MNKLVIFDFDGVLADSFEHLYAMNKAAAEFSAKTMSREDYRQIFAGKFHPSLHRFMALEEEEFKRYAEHKSSIFNDYYDKAGLFDFAPDLIQGLSPSASLAIVSSAPEESIRSMLNKYDLADSFILILGTNKDGKIANLKKCLETASSDKQHSFFVSDTTGDINEGNEIGLNTIAVTWGFHDSGVLRASQPKFLVDNFSEIIDIVKRSS